MYCQACRDHGAFDLTLGYGLTDLGAKEDLLKRRAHFDMAETTESASSAVSRLGNEKREWVAKIEEQLWIEAARARLLNMWNSTTKNAASAVRIEHPDAKDLVERVLL